MQQEAVTIDPVCSSGVCMQLKEKNPWPEWLREDLASRARMALGEARKA